MPTNYPYIASTGSIVKVIAHLRRSFPANIDSDVIKRLGLAPKNESYLINIIRFLGLIDGEGKKVEAAAKGFLVHEDSAFQKYLDSVVKGAYKELFDLHGEASWNLGYDKLITFFRQADGSSAVVGQRKAATFATLAAVCGHSELPKTKESDGAGSKKTSPRPDRVRAAKAPAFAGAVPPMPVQPPTSGSLNDSKVGLTVRIEINLPANGTKEVYDSIFQSIRKNLIDAK